MDKRMESCNSTRGRYLNKVYIYLKKLEPGAKIEIAKVSANPDDFVEAVKHAINLRTIEVELSNDYKYVIRKEDVNYERYQRKSKRRGNTRNTPDEGGNS